MTTIAVAIKDGMVAIGADSMTSFGHCAISNRIRSSKSHSKIHKMGDNYVAIAGFTIMGRILNAINEQEEFPTFKNGQEVFEHFNKLHPTLKKDYYVNSYPSGDFDDLESSGLHALIANTHGVWNVSTYRDVFSIDTFFARGSGDEFALGAMDAVYDFPQVSACDIVHQGISTAIKLDKSTDGDIVIHEIELASAIEEQKQLESLRIALTHEEEE